ncbi:uncharacterized protein LOC115153739 [Salmo trutta]|uniref:uncharacterized protein LOC115153739 n=1 Tax=Salmo trutta TaxID=8032 RepID=UPI001131B4F6|nr:uncharacterized protein LOC115153739 [Salmo trutta]
MPNDNSFLDTGHRPKQDYFEYSLKERDQIIVSESLFDMPGGNSDLSKELLHLSKRQTRTHLHIVTLSDYVRQGIIPRGLGWQKEPSLGQRTDDFCERWCAILNKCSIDLMTLIVDQLKKDFSEMDNTIKDKRTALQIAVNDDGIFNELMKTNQALQDKLSTEIKELKIKKFNQDKKDKAEDKVYFWRNPDKGGPAPLHGRRRRDDTYFDPPRSDQHSTTSASSASSGSFLFNERPGQRKGAGGRRHAHRRDAAPDGCDSLHLTVEAVICQGYCQKHQIPDVVNSNQAANGYANAFNTLGGTGVRACNRTHKL